ELLAQARHRTKRDILRLIRRIDPQPDAPASIEPLGPPPLGHPIPQANPSWDDFEVALSPPVLWLPPGDTPQHRFTGEAPTDDSDAGVPEPDCAPPALPKVPERYKSSSPRARSTSTSSSRPKTWRRTRSRAEPSNSCTCRRCDYSWCLQMVGVFASYA